MGCRESRLVIGDSILCNTSQYFSRNSFKTHCKSTCKRLENLCLFVSLSVCSEVYGLFFMIVILGLVMIVSKYMKLGDRKFPITNLIITYNHLLSASSVVCHKYANAQSIFLYISDGQPINSSTTFPQGLITVLQE